MIQLYIDYLDKVLEENLSKKDPEVIQRLMDSVSLYKIIGGNVNDLYYDISIEGIEVLGILDYRLTLKIKDLPKK